MYPGTMKDNMYGMLSMSSIIQLIFITPYSHYYFEILKVLPEELHFLLMNFSDNLKSQKLDCLCFCLFLFCLLFSYSFSFSKPIPITIITYTGTEEHSERNISVYEEETSQSMSLD